MTEQVRESKRSLVPLDVRLSYADELHAHRPGLNARRIAEIVGRDEVWVKRVAGEIGITATLEDVYDSKRKKQYIYPPYTAGILEEESSWDRQFKALPVAVSERKIAQTLGVTLDWARQNLEIIGAQLAPRKRWKSNAPHYSKHVLNELRPIAMEIPLDTDWYTEQQLVELVDMPRRWIRQKLQEGGYEPMDRRSVETREVGAYYSSETLNYLLVQKMERPKPAGDMMTVPMMAEYLNRSLAWVRQRISAYEHTKELRLDDNERPRMHYPFSVYLALKNQSEFLEQLPERNGEPLYSDLQGAVADLFDEPELLAAQRIKDANVYPQPRRNRKGTMVDVYTAEDIVLIKDAERKKIGETIDVQFAIGSLRSQIKLRESALALYVAAKPDDMREPNRMKRELTVLQSRLCAALEELYFIEAGEDSQNDEKANVA